MTQHTTTMPPTLPQRPPDPPRSSDCLASHPVVDLLPFGDDAGPPPSQNANDLFVTLYGQGHRFCPTPNPQIQLVLSRDREIDLLELESLCDAVGWSRRPLRRVRRALDNSLLRVGLWRHDPRLPRLVGFARCTGDGIVDATIWDVAVHPRYQGVGLEIGRAHV